MRVMDDDEDDCRRFPPSATVDGHDTKAALAVLHARRQLQAFRAVSMPAGATAFIEGRCSRYRVG